MSFIVKVTVLEMLIGEKRNQSHVVDANRQTGRRAGRHFRRERADQRCPKTSKWQILSGRKMSERCSGGRDSGAEGVLMRKKRAERKN